MSGSNLSAVTVKFSITLTPTGKKREFGAGSSKFQSKELISNPGFKIS